jgi:DNA polymerase III delta subunit
MRRNLFLHHGECEYLVLKACKEFKQKSKDNGYEIREILGHKNLDANVIIEAINSATLFGENFVVVLRDLGEGNSLFDFVDDLVEFLQQHENFYPLHIFHQGKISKNTKIFKLFEKLGKIDEYSIPTHPEMVKMVKKSLSIDNEAAELVVRNVNRDLFALRNEVKKLSTLNRYITFSDVETFGFRFIETQEIWSIGKDLINYLRNHNIQNKLNLLFGIEEFLVRDVDPMLILYSMYSYIIRFIKLQELVLQGKTFKECLSLGYYFVKENFDNVGKISNSELYKLNSDLLDYEFAVKNGDLDPTLGIRLFVLKL